MSYVMGEPLPNKLTIVSPGAPVSEGGLSVSGHETRLESAAPKAATAAPESPTPQASPNPFI